MNSDHRVPFGHSDTEQLILSNFKWASDTYSLDAELCVGSFRGAARVFGHTYELEILHKSLVEMSKTLSGEVKFENLEGQLNIHCSIGTTGTVHFDIEIADYPNRVKCKFDTDPTGLDKTIAALKILI